MKKITAFILGFVLFAVTVFSLHFITDKNLNMNNPKFGLWPNAYKDLSYEGVKSNLRDNTMLVYGSSELHHGKKGKYHPLTAFYNRDIELMLIGSALNQSLAHTISLGALEGELKNRKVVLFVSPSWYDKQGATKEGYKMRFSKSNYIALMNNRNISKSLKKKIEERNTKLLGKKSNLRDSFIANEKEKITLMTAMTVGKVKRLDTYPTGLSKNEPDWRALSREAEIESRYRSNNKFYMKDFLYTTKIKPVLKEKKNSALKASYGESPEYYDTELFLQLCKERNIEPLLVIQPINGYWYDYTGFPKEGRNTFHKRILKLADKYDAKVADFWDRSYEKYFLEDAVHPAGKGWVNYNEKIFEFYNGK